MNDNIISISIPNAISITLMAVVGCALLMLVRKAVLGTPQQIQANVPGQ